MRAAASIIPRALPLRWPAVATLLLAACAFGPPPPDWQMQAKAAMDRATTAYLTGDSRMELRELEQARNAIAATGRVEILARIELMRCAAHVASLEFEACQGFERLRLDAQPPELAYAEYLAGRTPSALALLPPQQREAAAAGRDGLAPADLQRIEEPLARLVAAAVLFQTGRASPPLFEVAVDTASSQGWRRPLLAWLKVELRGAEMAGSDREAGRLRRRIALVERDA